MIKNVCFVVMIRYPILEKPDRGVALVSVPPELKRKSIACLDLTDTAHKRHCRAYRAVRTLEFKVEAVRLAQIADCGALSRGLERLRVPPQPRRIWRADPDRSAAGYEAALPVAAPIVRYRTDGALRIE